MYISIAKPIKANIVQHIMNHNEFNDKLGDRQKNTNLMYAAMFRADVDVFNIMVTQADWDMNRVNDDGLNVMDLYLKDNDNNIMVTQADWDMNRVN